MSVCLMTPSEEGCSVSGSVDDGLNRSNKGKVYNV